MDIITSNQNQITQEIYNIPKHNFIAHLLPHIELLYNQLTTSITTQYNTTYYNDNYKQYYPNIQDYWKSIVSTSTTIMYHSLLRLFTLSTIFNNFNNIKSTLPTFPSSSLLSLSSTTLQGKSSLLEQQQEQ
eukprot:UN00091